MVVTEKLNKSSFHLLKYRIKELYMKLLYQSFYHWKMYQKTVYKGGEQYEINTLLSRINELEQQQITNSNVNSLHRKIHLLSTEVKERGNHIEYLIEENNRLTIALQQQQQISSSQQSDQLDHSLSLRHGISLQTLLSESRREKTANHSFYDNLSTSKFFDIK